MTTLIVLSLCFLASVEASPWDHAQMLAPGVLRLDTLTTLPDGKGLQCPSCLLFAPDQPRKQKVFAARIDFVQAGISLSTTGRAENWGQPMPDFQNENLSQFAIRTRNQTTLDYLKQARSENLPMVLAVNGAPWTPFTGADYPYADKMGLAISHGVLVCPPGLKSPSFLVDKQGHIDMAVIAPDSIPSSVDLAVTGFGYCLVNGLPNVNDTILHPRTGYGISQDKRYLYLVVIDGRQSSSQGATVRELGLWLQFMGAYSGINMDGGGSSTMVGWNSNTQSALVINSPSGGLLRKTGMNLGVVVKSTALFLPLHRQVFYGNIGTTSGLKGSPCFKLTGALVESPQSFNQATKVYSNQRILIVPSRARP